VKQENEQPAFNEGIINEDSLFKFLAYTAVLEKQRAERMKANKNDSNFAYELNMFE
jgi:hypothetical protein